MNCPVSDLLNAAFIENVPNDIARIVRIETCRPLLNQFKLGIILPWGKDAPVRVAWSAQQETARFREIVMSRHRDNSTLVEFIDDAPEACRRVLDTDGHSDHIFLDDLQAHGEKDATGADRICRIWSPNSEIEEIIKLSNSDTKPYLHRVSDRALMNLGGIWAARKNRNDILSTLWISESKWRKNDRITREWVEASNPPPAWGRIHDAFLRHRLRIYPDAVEFHADGRIDLTVGIL